MKKNWPCAAGRPTAISAMLLRRAPISGTTAWTSARTRARMRAKCPSSGIMVSLAQRGGGFLRLLDGVRGLGRHVVLVVLGEHLGGLEHASFELALHHRALALLEQVGQRALVGHRNDLGGIGDRKAHRDAVRF